MAAKMRVSRKPKASIARMWAVRCMAVVIAVTAVVLLAREFLTVQEIEFSGNQHLKSEDLQNLLGCVPGSRIFGVSARQLQQRLKTSPWIKECRVRRDLTGTITVQVIEATPIALLLDKGRHYLVDGAGVLLEEIRGELVYFLPVIRIDPNAYAEAYREAVAFATVLFQKRSFSYGSTIEISGTRAEDMTMTVDGIPVRIGAGDFVRKLERLRFVRGEVAKRNMVVAAIDVRFSDKVVVTPLKPKVPAEKHRIKKGTAPKAKVNKTVRKETRAAKRKHETG